MKMTRFFLPTTREAPSDAEAISHKLMLKAGMIRQTARGIYAWLPLGFRVLKKIEAIVREEMENADCVELLMPTIQTADLWRESGRYEEFGPELLRFTDRHGRELLYGPTNEEQITDLFRYGNLSYRDLPVRLFHIQWKFRDEVRPRFGVMRGREFLMKDAYSFDLTAQGAEMTYRRMFAAYMAAFQRMGLRPIPVRAATGAIGGSLSHEFHVLTPIGESKIEFDARFAGHSPYAVSASIDPMTLYGYTDDYEGERLPPPDATRCGISTEIGHIFYLGDKYSKSFKATVNDDKGENVTVQMGCYGIGVSRLVAAIIEANHDEAGIIFPRTVAPFAVGLIGAGNEAEIKRLCEKLYDHLHHDLMIEVVYDDRDVRPGVKFNIMDLIGVPQQIIVGSKSLEKGVVEIKERATGVRGEFPVAMLSDIGSVLR